MIKIKPLHNNIKLCCVICSDTHIDIEHPYKWMPKMRLKNCLKDSQKSENEIDAFIINGDTTSHSVSENWDMAVECFEKIENPAKQVILAVGNHDCWSDTTFEEARDTYFRYYEKICGKRIEKTYFSYCLNGYKFIFLGNESASGCGAVISDEQIEWFKKEIEEGSQKNKPVFVFCHQSLNQKHGLPYTWDKEKKDYPPEEGGIGEKSEEIEQIMKSYKNIFYFSGHSHMGFLGEKSLKENGYSSIYEENGLTLINTPSVSCGNHDGEYNRFACGIVLEVYDDKVVIRPRDFKKRKFINIKIKDSKPYFEKEI